MVSTTLCHNASGLNRLSIVILYVFAMFITSDDSSLRILSMTQYNLVAFVMIGLSLSSMLYSGKLTISLSRQLKYLYVLFIWIVISLILSKVIETKAVLGEVYNYDWVSGVNSPSLRGISFIIRYSLSLCVIQFIINSVDSKAKYSTVMKYFLYAFGIFALFPVLQILLLLVANVEIGKVFYDGTTNRARIGSYVGEPSVLAGMLCCGVFPLISAIKIQNNILHLNKIMSVAVLGLALIGLFFTSSASIIAAMILSFILSVRKFIGMKTWLFFLVVLIGLALTSSSFQDVILFKIFNELSTVNIRSLSWIVGYNSIVANPLSGVGIGQAPFYVAPYLPWLSDIPFDINTDFNFSEGRYTPMNTYLEFTTETGVIGIFLLFLFVRDIYNYQNKKNNNNEVRYIQFAFGTGLLAIAFAMNSFPGGFYLGYVNFMIGMYIAGLKIYSAPIQSGVVL